MTNYSSDDILKALDLGWKEIACEFMDHGPRVGFESPDGKWFLTAPQLAHMMRTGCRPEDVPPAEPL